MRTDYMREVEKWLNGLKFNLVLPKGVQVILQAHEGTQNFRFLIKKGLAYKMLSITRDTIRNKDAYVIETRLHALIEEISAL